MNAQLRERLYSRLRAEYGPDSIEQLARQIPSLVIPEGLRLTDAERALLIDAINAYVKRSGNEDVAMEFMGMFLLDGVDSSGRIDNVKGAAHLLAGFYGNSPNNFALFQALSETVESVSANLCCNLIIDAAKLESDFLCCHMGCMPRWPTTTS